MATSDNHKQKRKAFTLQTKYEIIKKIQSGSKQSDVCKEMGLNKPTVCMIWKERDNILSSYEQENSNAKKLRKSAHDEVDKGLLLWFSQQRGKNATISGALLQSKAEDLGSKVENSDFKCTRSWIERFKKRHNINSGKIVGEAASVNMEVVDDWLQNKWPNIRENYEAHDIFNADETGLFYKLTPNRTLKFKGENCIGGKLSKERITVLVAANFTGTEKRRLLIIGKSQKPRCFRNRRLPVKYTANKKAWMTSDIFCNELRDWDNELRTRNRKILLLVDNCPAHPEVKNLKFIKLVFMPPNTSSKLQPMDQGVIHSLKSNYRRILLSKIMINSGEEYDRSNLLDAVNCIHMAWQNVTAKTISNCFQHAEFLKHQNAFDDDDEVPLSEWLKRSNLDNVGNNGDAVPVTAEMDVNFEDYVRIDEDVQCREALTDDDIVALVHSIPAINTNARSDEEDSNEAEDTVANVSSQQVPIVKVVQNVGLVRDFLQMHDAPNNILNSLANVEMYLNDIYLTLSYKQSKISNYFKQSDK